MITNNPANMSVRGASTETTRFYMGSLVSFLVKSSQTRNGLCRLEYRSQPGHEPPPHIHLDQDEAFLRCTAWARSRRRGRVKRYFSPVIRLTRGGGRPSTTDIP